MARVKQNEQWDCIDKIGELVIDSKFAIAADLHEVLAAVKLKKWGIINQTGQFAVITQYDDIYSFYGGQRTIILNREKRIIDRQGDLIDQSNQQNLINNDK